MRLLYFISLILTCVLFFTCEKEQGNDRYELQIPAGFPDPIFPQDNQLTKSRATLGKKLFYEKALSRDSTLSCGSCHKQINAFADNSPISGGIEGRMGSRNSPSLANVAYLDLINKDGGVTKLDIQAFVPIEDENEMDISGLLVADRLKEDDEYVKLSQEAYGRNPDIYVIPRALATFIRTMISGDSPYDQYAYQNDRGALNEQQLLGKELFFGEKLKCGSCHTGFNFTNNAFENNGIYDTYQDPGRMGITGDESDRGKFRVSSLRNIAVTRPYMHNGSIPDLAAVLDHYSSGGSDHMNKSESIQGFDLSELEKIAVIAFLESLTDESFLTNPEFAE